MNDVNLAWFYLNLAQLRWSAVDRAWILNYLTWCDVNLTQLQIRWSAVDRTQIFTHLTWHDVNLAQLRWSAGDCAQISRIFDNSTPILHNVCLNRKKYQILKYTVVIFDNRRWNLWHFISVSDVSESLAILSTNLVQFKSKCTWPRIFFQENLTNTAIWLWKALNVTHFK